MNKSEEKQLWDDFYRADRFLMWWPSECIVRFVAKYVTGAETKVLDFGCGNGRHLFLLTKRGLKPSGVEVSGEALAVARRWMDSEGYDADLRLYDGITLPHEDSTFDVVISYGVLDHMRLAEAKRCAAEMARVLRPGGRLCVTLAAVTDFRYGVGQEIEKNTFIIDSDVEGGLPQHYFSRQDILDCFSGFFDIELQLEDRLSGEDLSTRISRWVVSAVRS